MWTHLEPWPPSLTIFKVRDKVVRGQRPSRPVINTHGLQMSDDMWRLIKQCWDQDPNRRPKSNHLMDFFDRDGQTLAYDSRLSIQADQNSFMGNEPLDTHLPLRDYKFSTTALLSC